jgi:hypothetical protein
MPSYIYIYNRHIQKIGVRVTIRVQNLGYLSPQKYKVKLSVGHPRGNPHVPPHGP